MRSGAPSLEGVIGRRVLINYRADPDVVARMLPSPLRPHEIDGHAIAGICLIRLRSLRPRGFPRWMGHRSENAAHRIAVVWDDGDQRRTGVFIPCRDTDSAASVLLGGRLYPGEHHPAEFDVSDRIANTSLRMRSRDGQRFVSIVAEPADTLPAASVFESVDAASRFFERGSVGLSPSSDGGVRALELETPHWAVTPLSVQSLASSYFDDETRFPPGSVSFDSALLMRDVEHRWHVRADLGWDRQDAPTRNRGRVDR
ncbi:MAG: DUF2071 domain-containing protein [Nitriliruptorales bacterium]